MSRAKEIRHIIVKIGSGVIEAHKTKSEGSDLSALVEEMSRLHENGTAIVLVSSGAIILGMGELNLKTRPADLASLQACAAVGQAVLMRTYSRLFERHKIKCAQILLTWDDFNDPKRRENARHTLKKLLENTVVPIINENDTTSTDEIKFGDNDKLSAKVAKLIDADRLVILSSGVKGFHDDKGKHIPRVDGKITDQIQSFAMDTTNKNVSKGGMITKLEAVKVATSNGIPCVIAGSGTASVLTSVVQGEPRGTYFAPVKHGTYPSEEEKNESSR